MKRIFGINSIKLIYIAFGMFLSAGLLLAVGMVGLYSANYFMVDEAFLRIWNIISSIFIGLVLFILGLVILSIWRRENEATELIAWLNKVNFLTSTYRYPITQDTLYRTGNCFAEILPDNKGWIMIAQVPGILTKEESERRINVIASSKHGDPKLREWSQQYLVDLLDRNESIAGIFECPKATETAMGIFINKSKGGDIAIGFMSMVDPLGTYPTHPLSNEIINTSLGLFLQRISVLLIDVIDNKSRMSDEGLGLMYRTLGHEMMNELQAGFYETNVIPESLVTVKSTIDSVLWRVKHWIDIMRDAPVLQDRWFAQEESESLCIDDILYSLIDESQKAWPRISFELTGNEDVIVKAGGHIISIFRNVLFNAGSFSPDNGVIKIDISTDNNFAYVSIVDQGPGVTKEQANELFQAPVKSSVRPSGKKGTGIGLWVASKIALSYGGELTCIPKVEINDGGYFIIKLPLDIESGMEWQDDNVPLFEEAIN